MLDHDRIIGEEAEALAVAGETGDLDAVVPGTDWPTSSTTPAG